MRLEEWQLWVHPYPTLIKHRGRRLDPSKFPVGRIFRDGKEMVSLAHVFEERKKTPPQLKRCVRAVAEKELEGKDSSDKDTVRKATSKAFAICTAQLQKTGYLKVGSQAPTKSGKKAGRSKAGQGGHAGKVQDYERLLAVARGESFEGLHEAEGGFKLNVATVPLAKARAYAETVFKKAGKSLDRELPDFDERYKALQKKTRQALDVPRIQMPVIEPKDMKEFDKRLKTGRLDIFKPYAKGKLITPKGLERDREKGREWVKLGIKDGNKNDDVVKARWTAIAAKRLLPTQSQIWLEKLVKNIAKWGTPKPGSPVLKTTVIVSRDGYILDGHHRFGQVMLANPNLKIRALFVPLPIKLLLKIGRTYGNAIGNQQKG